MNLKLHPKFYHLAIVFTILCLPSLLHLPGSIQYARFFKSYHEPILFSRHLALLGYAYLNYYLLVPRFYLKNQYWLYAGLVLAFGLLIVGVPELFVQARVKFNPPADLPQLPPPPPFSWEINNLVLFFLISTLAGIVLKKRSLLQQYLQQNEVALQLLEQQQAELRANTPKLQETGLMVTVNYSLTRIDFADILFVKSMDNYVQFHLKGKKSLLVRMTLKEVCDKLPIDAFVRTHKSYLVALPAIEQVRNKVILIGEHRIPLGPSFEKPFFAIFEKHG